MASKNTTGDLFSPATAPTRSTDPETSFQAADAIRAHTPTIRKEVEQYAKGRGAVGFIDEELSAAFDSESQSSYRTRRAELVELGLIVDSGQRRKNEGGRDCVVWVHIDHKPDRRVAPHVSKDPLPEAPAKRRGSAWARRCDEFAAQMLSEGRVGFSRELKEIASTLRELSR